MDRKKVLGIIGSYRKVGNSEIVCKAVAEKMGGERDFSLVRLPKLRIYPCKGCYACLIPGKKCNLEDDVAWLLEKINEADAVIFAAPNYTLGPIGIVKMLSDRAIQAVAYHEKYKEKKTAVALTLGKEDYRGYADTALVSQVMTIGLNIVNMDYFYGTHPGEVALSEDFQEKTQNLADSLTAMDFKKDVAPNRCPVCFSDLFRIREEGLECAICKALAKLEGNTLRFFSFHPQFTEEGRIEHFKWLMMKKEEYPKIKGQLKKIQDQYSEGNWITP